MIPLKWSGSWRSQAASGSRKEQPIISRMEAPRVDTMRAQWNT